MIPEILVTYQGSRAELTCSVCTAFTPTLVWTFTQRQSYKTKVIARRSQLLSYEYSLMTDHRSQTLIIGNAQWRHVGIYKCTTSDSTNSTVIEAEARLDVLSESVQCNFRKAQSRYLLYNYTVHTYTVPLSRLSVRGYNNNPKELDTVIIECDVTANPPANITWLKRTRERVRILTLNSKISIACQLINTPSGPLFRCTLIIRNVEENDSGNYICEARNNHSPSESANFNFTVISEYNLLFLIVIARAFYIYPIAQNDCIIDNLGSSPCQNHGVCIDHINGYICHCRGNHIGVNCSEKGIKMSTF